MPEIMVRFDDLRRYCERRHVGSVPLEYIKQMPTIEAEPVRHGSWIEETEPDENGNVTAMCNQCYHTDEHCKNIKPPYCWYCGTRMDATDTNVGGKGGDDNVSNV